MQYNYVGFSRILGIYLINYPKMKASKFLDQVKEVIYTNHISYSTEKTNIDWIYRFIIFRYKRHPEEKGGKKIAEFE